MKNKGFTLVELLAVIVILALIIGVAVPSTVKVSNKIKDNLYCEKIKTIQNAAMLYGEDRKGSFKNSGSEYNFSINTLCCTDSQNRKYTVDGGVFPNAGKSFTVGKLVETGYLKKDQNKTGEFIVDPRTKQGMDNLKVFIYEKYARIYVHFESNEANACVQSASSCTVGAC